MVRILYNLILHVDFCDFFIILTAYGFPPTALIMAISVKIRTTILPFTLVLSKGYCETYPTDKQTGCQKGKCETVELKLRNLFSNSLSLIHI